MALQRRTKIVLGVFLLLLAALIASVAIKVPSTLNSTAFTRLGFSISPSNSADKDVHTRGMRSAFDTVTNFDPSSLKNIL